ncbi:MAG: hypothetical protein IT374_09460 [Polyangiaceae bacterium]|nr:hypothetical protein [Polyangiaceae bacterium]
MRRAWLLAAVLAMTGCTAKGSSPDGERCGPATSAAPVDDVLLAYLSRARALHLEADVAEASGDPARAKAALSRLIDAPEPRPAPEIDEVVADTRARLAEIRARGGDFDAAERDVGAGLDRAREPTYFRGHLYEVLGLVHERRAAALEKAGRADDAKAARARAIDASEEAVKIQDHVLQRVAPSPATSGARP